MDRKKPIPKLFHRGFLAGLLLFSLVSHTALGRNYVKIATIGAPSPSLDLTQDPQKLVEQMIEFWDMELKQVLPDKPDLIDLPEACDRPAGMTTEFQFKYFKARGNQKKDWKMNCIKY